MSEAQVTLAAVDQKTDSLGRIVVDLDNLRVVVSGVRQAFELDSTLFNAAKAYVLRCQDGTVLPEKVLDDGKRAPSKIVSVNIDTYTNIKNALAAEE